MLLRKQIYVLLLNNRVVESGTLWYNVSALSIYNVTLQNLINVVLILKKTNTHLAKDEI